MPDIVQVILIALVAGAVGTLVGGILGVLVKRPSKNHIGLLLGFAAGAMLGVALYELLREAVRYGDAIFNGGGILAMLIGVILGVLFMVLLEPKNSNAQMNTENHSVSNIKIDNQEAQTIYEQKNFKRLGIAVFLVILLHDFPEGLAIGAGHHVGSAFIFGVVLLLHNIPEGLAIAVPLKASGTKAKKILVICFVAGLPTLLGAVLGYFVGQVDWLLAYTFAFAAGVMLYIVFSEMLPIAYRYAKSKKILTLCIMSGAMVLIVFAVVLH